MHIYQGFFEESEIYGLSPRLGISVEDVAMDLDGTEPSTADAI